jgi:ribosomal protein S7
MKQHINIAIDSKYNAHTMLKKYSVIRNSLFNYWSLLFYNKYLYYFFNCFLQRGKKQIAIKIVYYLLYVLKRKTMISPILVLQSALLNYRHILKLRIIKYKRKKIFSYLLLSLNKQVKVSIKYLAKQFSSFNISSTKYTLVERLSIFILNLFFRTPLIFGRFLQHSAQVHKLIQENQKVIKKFKRKKFRKRRRFRAKRRSKFSFKSKFNIRSNGRKKLRSKYGTSSYSIKKKSTTSVNVRRSSMSKRKNMLGKKERRVLKGVKTKAMKRRMKLFSLTRKDLRLLLLKRKKRQLRLKPMKLIKRRIRRVLTRKFTRPLHKRTYIMKKRKISEFNICVKQLYTDLSNGIDFNVLTDINTDRTFFINSNTTTQMRKFFFYVILGKWYKVLEKTYYYLTMPFWHLYNLRTKLLRHKVFDKALVQQIVPQVQNNYTKYLIKYVNNTVAIKQKIKETVTNSQFVVDPLLLSRYVTLYKGKNKLTTSISNKNNITVLHFNNTLININNVLKKKRKIRKKSNNIIKTSSLFSLNLLLKRKKIRTYIRGYRNRIKIKSRVLKLIRIFSLQHIMKQKRRRYLPIINILTKIKRYFYTIIRFRLIRLVWFALRALSLRRTRPLFERTKRSVATRVFLFK